MDVKVIKSMRPVFLTKNGRGRYMLLDIQEYKKQQAVIKLLSKLSEAEDAIKAGEEWKSLDDLKNRARIEKQP
jgi:PHD/YefM family antitoxin component YafN of YafNO toxin-antitoxin module